LPPGEQIDTVHRTRRQTEFAAGAFCLDHGVHLTGCSEDCIDGAGLNTQGAADTAVFIDQCNQWWLMFSTFTVERLGFRPKQVCQCFDPFFATWRALIDVGLPRSNGLGIRSTAREAALRALRLRE
jgi:hypothetical protein